MGRIGDEEKKESNGVKFGKGQRVVRGVINVIDGIRGNAVLSSPKGKPVQSLVEAVY